MRGNTKLLHLLPILLLVLSAGSSRTIYGALGPAAALTQAAKPLTKSRLGNMITPDRVGMGGPPCTTDDIIVSQGATTPLPNGIPTYTVSIENQCLSGNCTISDIHVRCGWFSSYRLIDPNIFRRIAYDDCLVNGGRPLNPGETLNFQYADSFPYPMSVSSISC